MALPSDYINSYLKPCPGYGWAGGPTFSTELVSLMNGREKRNARWKQPRHTFSAPFQNISQQAFREIKAMFVNCQGMAKAFRFRDENDYEADDVQFAVGDGGSTYQMGVVEVVGDHSYVREVYALGYHSVDH
jgi:uncharacterized protein (TIGR02217 family)